MTTQQRFDTQILLALFKVTTEHSTYVNNTYQHKAHHKFKEWQRLGFRMLEQFEEDSLTEYKLIEEIADQMQNMIYEARKLSLSEIEQNEKIN